MVVQVGGSDPRRDLYAGLALVVVFAVPLGVGIYDVHAQSDRLADPEPVQAEVLETDVEERTLLEQPTGLETTYVSAVTYEYTYGDRRYESSQFYAAPLATAQHDTRRAAREALDEYDGGDTVTAYVPPSEPAAAFLSRDRHSGWVVPTGIGVIGILAGLRYASRWARAWWRAV